jgi:hypothetical protein
MPLPSLLEQLDLLKDVPSEDMTSAAADLSSNLNLLLKALAIWCHHLHSKCQGVSGWPAEKGKGEFHFVFDDLVPLWFPTILVANTMCHFWALSLIAMSNFRGLLTTSGSGVAGGCQKTSLDSTSWTEQMDAYAENICRSIDYHVQPGMKLFRPPSMFFPLSVAYNYFNERGSQKAAQRDWCKSKIDQLVAHGFKLADFV